MRPLGSEGMAFIVRDCTHKNTVPYTEQAHGDGGYRWRSAHLCVRCEAVFWFV